MSLGPDIRIARVHDDADRTSGTRLLVDRVWPRGVGKAELQLDEWIRDVAPSSDLRKWFGHDPEKWQEFQERYRAELDNNPEAVERCLGWSREGPVTLLFAAKDRDHNQAVVLRRYLIERARACGERYGLPDEDVRPRHYASPPCMAHEVDPAYFDPSVVDPNVGRGAPRSPGSEDAGPDRMDSLERSR